MVYILLLIVSLALLVLSFRHWRVKRQIRNIEKQLRENAPRRRIVSIELVDKEVEALTLAINNLTEEHNQMLLEAGKKHEYLKSSIADISHDMRTPLTSTIGYLQLLSRGNLDNEQARYLNIALEKSQSLRKLLEDFFELSTLIANDGSTMELTKVDVAGVVSDVILEHANEFAEKAITPIFAMSDKPVFIWGDIEKLHRIIENLISNCLKYASGDVVFKITENEVICLTIENPTIHINEINTERLFERFYKANTSRNEQGTGLGLSIAQLLTKSLSGSISAHIENNLFVVQLSFSRYEGQCQ